MSTPADRPIITRESSIWATLLPCLEYRVQSAFGQTTEQLTTISDLSNILYLQVLTMTSATHSKLIDIRLIDMCILFSDATFILVFTLINNNNNNSNTPLMCMYKTIQFNYNKTICLDYT